jgi:hypothetical protein
MSSLDFYLPLDLTGVASTNLIANEVHVFGNQPTRFLILEYGSFYTESLRVNQVNPNGTLTPLRIKDQVWPVEMLSKTTLRVGKEIQSALLITDSAVTGSLSVTYQALGGSCSANVRLLKAAIASTESSQNVDWASLNKPKEFTPSAHLHDALDIYGLEYIRDELKRIKEVIGMNDDAIHNEIMDQMFVNKSKGFFNLFDNDFNNRFDFIINQADIVSENLRRTNEVWLDVKKTNERIRKITDLAVYQNAQFELRHRAAPYALTLMNMTNQLWSQKKLVLSVPELVGGLSAWLKFSEPSSVTVDDFGGFQIKDKVDTGRVFSGTGVKYARNTSINSYVARFTGRAELKKLAGSMVSLNGPSTIFTVTAGNSSGIERLDILSGPAGRFSTDIGRTTLYELNDFEKPTLDAYARAGTDRSDKLSSHMGVCAFSDDAKEDYCWSNTPESNYRGYNGFNKKPVRASIWNFDRIGNSNYEQVGDIAEIIVFNRQLSHQETDAVFLYLKLLYGVEMTLVVNGAFKGGLTEFETDYTLSRDADNPGEVAVVFRENSNNFTGPFARFYVFKSMIDLVRSSAPRVKFLAANVGTDLSKSFWKQKMVLDRFTTHTLRLTVLSEDTSSLPLTLKLNGAEVTLNSRVKLDQYTQALTYVFKPSTDFCELSLYSRAPSCVLGLLDLYLSRTPALK